MSDRIEEIKMRLTHDLFTKQDREDINFLLGSLDAAEQHVKILRARAERAEAQVEELQSHLNLNFEKECWEKLKRAEQFVRDHTTPSCTNPICDCVEARLHRAERIVEAVRAVCIEEVRYTFSGSDVHKAVSNIVAAIAEST